MQAVHPPPPCRPWCRHWHRRCQAGRAAAGCRMGCRTEALRGGDDGKGVVEGAGEACTGSSMVLHANTCMVRMWLVRRAARGNEHPALPPPSQFSVLSHPDPTHRSPCLQPPCEPRPAEHCSSCVRAAARRAECLPTPPAPSCCNRKMRGWVCKARIMHAASGRRLKLKEKRLGAVAAQAGARWPHRGGLELGRTSMTLDSTPRHQQLSSRPRTRPRLLLPGRPGALPAAANDV